eukprot:GFKZ01013158.1.p1 GENE.GFKZ01013158.1~~GFKZ01013158.1.p1  ORF type:complete len:751 (+),score=90.29 GFKZ01013158.1:116-2254(+)
MDEFLANLNTDPPMFDASTVLGSAFDMENGFMTDSQDVSSLYADLPTLRQSSTPQTTTPTPLPVSSNEIDYLAVDADQPQSAKAKKEIFNDIPTLSPTPIQNPPASRSQPSRVDPPVPEVPDTPLEAERKRQRPLADTVVAESWQANKNPADFVAIARSRLPTRGQGIPSSIVEESSSMVTTRVEDNEEDDLHGWGLPESSEGALLDALFHRLCAGNAPSSRLMDYLSYSLSMGVVSQRAVVASCLKWVNATPSISVNVLNALAKLLTKIIPNYRFSFEEGDLTAEVKEFLGAFTLVVRCTATSPFLAPELVSVLSHDRVIALVRACARRVPSAWQQIDDAIAGFENTGETTGNMYEDTFPPRTAYSEAPELKKCIARLRKGLAMGIKSLESIAQSIGNIGFPDEKATLIMALQTAFAVTLAVFDKDIAKSLRHLWSQREAQGGDYHLLVALEKGAVASSNGQGSSPKCSFRNKVVACEAIVQFLGERACLPGASERWKSHFGGKERLKRLIRDAIPQVKNEIKSETGALLVSMVVTCCAAMCLGPALRMYDANDGVDVEDPAEVSMQVTQNEEVEETMGELVGFAVGCLEDAATAEEIPTWRSFGLWLLYLMSRAGSMLRASGCEHVRATHVLRTWASMPSGTPGTHAAHANSKHAGQGSSAHHPQHGSSSYANMEGVALFATPASLAIIDASDVSGSDETIRALCEDLVQ